MIDKQENNSTYTNTATQWQPATKKDNDNGLYRINLKENILHLSMKAITESILISSYKH